MKKEKFTAIYVEGWLSGAHYHSITRMKRFTLKAKENGEMETVLEALVREGIEAKTQFLFEGHPKLQGE